MPVRELSVEEQKDLDDAYAMARSIMKKHKKLDVEIARMFPTHPMNILQPMRDRLSALSKDLRHAVKKVLDCGGEWDYEKERLKIVG